MAEIKNSESDMSTQQKAELDKEKRREERGKKSKKTALQGTEWATKTHRAWGSGKCSHPWNRSRTDSTLLLWIEIPKRFWRIYIWQITDLFSATMAPAITAGRANKSYKKDETNWKLVLMLHTRIYPISIIYPMKNNLQWLRSIKNAFQMYIIRFRKKGKHLWKQSANDRVYTLRPISSYLFFQKQPATYTYPSISS